MTQKCSGVDGSQLTMMHDFALGTEHIGLSSPLVLVSIARRRLTCPESFFSPPLVYPGSIVAAAFSSLITMDLGKRMIRLGTCTTSASTQQSVVNLAAVGRA